MNNKLKYTISVVVFVLSICLLPGCEKKLPEGNDSAEIHKEFLEKIWTDIYALNNTEDNHIEKKEQTNEEDIAGKDLIEQESVALEVPEPKPTDEGYDISTEEIAVNSSWEYADSSAINWGTAILYKRSSGWNGITVGVNAGHGTNGSYNYQTYCHPDRTPKVTGGTTAAGSVTAVAVSSGMTFYDGTPESAVNLCVAQKLKDKLLDYGYNVLMIRDGDDVQLDNVARTVICNNMADCHLAIHFDGDGLSYDKGAFFMSVPDALKYMDPVSYTWEKSEAFGWSIIEGLTNVGVGINGSGNMDMDLTQTSYSTVASIDVELGNASSDHSDYYTDLLAEGLLNGINIYFNK